MRGRPDLLSEVRASSLEDLGLEMGSEGKDLSPERGGGLCVLSVVTSFGASNHRS